MQDIRRRTGPLLLGVVLAHLVLISAQVNAKAGGKLLEVVVFAAFSEVQRAVAAAWTAAAGVWGGYVDLRGVREENERLKARVAALEVDVQALRAQALQAERLQLLLRIQAEVPQRTLAARVIGADASAWFRTVTIDRGLQDGVTRDMAVIAPQGVVGRVLDQVAPRAARVQLLVDRNAGAAAVVERSRAGGVVVGAPQGSGLRLEYVSAAADVRVGDIVVSSGQDGIYPKGFVIGTVVEIERGGGGYTSIHVRPAVDFSSLEEVLVVLDPPAAAVRGGGAG
jgi:rod shape-determining protein MreC